MGNFNLRRDPKPGESRDTTICNAIARAKHLDAKIDSYFEKDGVRVDFTVSPDSKMKDVINDHFSSVKLSNTL